MKGSLIFALLDSRRRPDADRGRLFLRGFEDSLTINVEEQSDPEKTSGEIRSAVAHERQRQSFVRQERSRDADVHRGLQTEERDDPAAQEQTEAVLRVER